MNQENVHLPDGDRQLAGNDRETFADQRRTALGTGRRALERVVPSGLVLLAMATAGLGQSWTLPNRLEVSSPEGERLAMGGAFKDQGVGHCSNANAIVSVGAIELCNGLDDDCDGDVDETCGAQRLSAHIGQLCLLPASQRAECWTIRDDYKVAEPPPLDTLVAVTSAKNQNCGLKDDGGIVCWGVGAVADLPPPSGPFTGIEAGLLHACAWRADGSAECWGWNREGESDVPSGTYQRLAPGNRFTCGLLQSGAILCWGRNDHGETAAPAGTFTTITAGNGFACALEEGGTVQCWGNDGHGVVSGAPAGAFTAIAATSYNVCGLREADGSAVCWGFSAAAMTPPAGSFEEIAVGSLHACGRRPNGEVVCWGDPAFWHHPPPGR